MRGAAALLTFILLAAAPALAEIPNFRQGMPQDVTGWLDREDQCLHWYGEDPSDPKRAKEIETAIGKLKCDALPDDLQALRDKHHDDANILGRLNEAEEYYSATD